MHQTFVYFHVVSSFPRVQPGLSYQFMVTINVEGSIAAVASGSNRRSNQRKPQKPSLGSSPTHKSDPENEEFSVREDLTQASKICFLYGCRVCIKCYDMLHSRIVYNRCMTSFTASVVWRPQSVSGSKSTNKNSFIQLSEADTHLLHTH